MRLHAHPPALILWPRARSCQVEHIMDEGLEGLEGLGTM